MARRDFWQGADSRTDGKLRPYLRPYDAEVVEIGTGANAGKVKVRFPGEETATADLPWCPVLGSMPTLGARVMVAANAFSRYVIVGGTVSGGGGGVTSFDGETGAVIRTIADDTHTGSVAITSYPVGSSTMRVTAASSGWPVASTAFTILTVKSANNRGFQIAVGAASEEYYLRRWDFGSTAWIAWVNMRLAANITNTPAGNIAATNVQAALNELDTEKKAASALDGHAVQEGGTPLTQRAALNFGAGLLATDDAANGRTNVDIDTHVHGASAVSNTPAGNIAATTVQAAINELDSEKIAGIAVEEDGTEEGTGIKRLNFTTGVDLSVTGDEATVSVPGGGGGGYATLVALTSDVSDISADVNIYKDVTGLSFAVTAGTNYRFRAMIVYETTVLGSGTRWAINGPATPTILAYSSRWKLTGGTEQLFYLVNYDGGTVSTASHALTDNLAVIEGIIRPSASGTVVVRMAKETSGADLTAKAGSTLEYW